MQATPEYMQLAAQDDLEALGDRKDTCERRAGLAPRRQSTELDARASPMILYCIHTVLNAGPPLGGQPGMALWRGAFAAPSAQNIASAELAMNSPAMGARYTWCAWPLGYDLEVCRCFGGWIQVRIPVPTSTKKRGGYQATIQRLDPR